MTQPPPIVPGRPEQPDSYTLATVMPVSKPEPRRWGLAIVVFVVVVLAGSSGVLLYPRLRGHSVPVAAPTMTTTHASPADAKPAVGIVTGAFGLYNQSAGWKDGDTCTGTGGFADIQTGAQIKVTGPTGEILGLGELLPGGTAHKVSTKVACVWFIHIGNIPTGKGFYGIEISHRGIVQYSEAELFGPGAELTLTLGDAG